MAVTYVEVGISLGRPITSAAEIAQVNQWVGDAELQIAARLGDISLLDQPVLEFVVREAVVTRMRNPEGFLSETADDYTYRMPEETRRVMILPEWWTLLRGGVSAGLFTARPSFERDTTASPAQWSEVT